MSENNNINSNSTAVMQPIVVKNLILNINTENLADSAAMEKPMDKEIKEPLPFTEEGNICHCEDFFNSLRKRNMGENFDG